MIHLNWGGGKFKEAQGSTGGTSSSMFCQYRQPPCIKGRGLKERKDGTEGIAGMHHKKESSNQGVERNTKDAEVTGW